MERIQKLIDNQDYRLCLQKNSRAEEERNFCRHYFEHLLDVARLTYILLLETGTPFISKEVAYAAGLLHDIGRWQEYESGKDHAIFSAELAAPILDSAGFFTAETNLICKAIRQHRHSAGKYHDEHCSPLSTALVAADSLSRLCFQCSALSSCKKKSEQPHLSKLLY